MANKIVNTNKTNLKDNSSKKLVTELPEVEEGLENYNLEDIYSGDREFEIGEKQTNVIPIRRPGSQQFFMVHPDPNYCIKCSVIEVKDEIGPKETYVIHKKMVDYLRLRKVTMVSKILYLTITPNGNVAFWPIRLPDMHGRLDTWNQSARDLISIAREKWIRLVPNLENAGYDYVEAKYILEPKWPKESIEKLFSIAIKGRVIDDPNHPIAKKLCGDIPE